MSRACLICNGPSAAGYKPEPMDYVVVLNGGLAQGLASVNKLYDNGAQGSFDILNIHIC